MRGCRGIRRAAIPILILALWTGLACQRADREPEPAPPPALAGPVSPEPLPAPEEPEALGAAPDEPASREALARDHAAVRRLLDELQTRFDEAYEKGVSPYDAARWSRWSEEHGRRTLALQETMKKRYAVGMGKDTPVHAMGRELAAVCASLQALRADFSAVLGDTRQRAEAAAFRAKAIDPPLARVAEFLKDPGT